MILDRVMAMHRHLKLRTPPPARKEMRHNNETTVESEPARYLAQVEAALHIVPYGQLGDRVAYAESVVARRPRPAPMPTFTIGDRVEYMSSSFPKDSHGEGVVDLIADTVRVKMETGSFKGAHRYFNRDGTGTGWSIPGRGSDPGSKLVKLPPRCAFAVGDTVRYMKPGTVGGHYGDGEVVSIGATVRVKLTSGPMMRSHRQFTLAGVGFGGTMDEEGADVGSKLVKLPAVPRAKFNVGDRVTCISTIVPRYTGKSGVVTAHRSDIDGCTVTLDGETAARWFPFTDLKREEPNMTIIASVQAAVAGFFGYSAPTSISTAARELLAATNLASIATNRKDRAKKALQSLGYLLPEYRPGTVRIYDGHDFAIDAVTKEPASRLDQTLLTDELRRAGLSRATITRCMAAATVENKAATSVVVTEK